MPFIKLLSSDFNGTLVHPHTMQEMIRMAFPEEPARYERARTAFHLQTEGRLSMAETFRTAGEQTRGLSLRRAIHYAVEQMTFVDGYLDLAKFIKERGIHFAIISTAYSVTMHAVRHGTPLSPFHARCNRLLFADPSGRVLEEDKLEALVRTYIHSPGARGRDAYDRILATGRVVLGIRNEEEKAQLALKLACSLGVAPDQLAHLGDTMGDSGGILGVARAGGMGIAFNYNQALKDFLLEEGKREVEAGRIVILNPKGLSASLLEVVELLKEDA